VRPLPLAGGGLGLLDRLPRRVSVLGGFSVGTGSAPPSIPACRLIAFVALTGQPVARGHVAFSLWPDASEEHARRSLRTALWAVRQCDPQLLAADDASVWAPSPIWLDLRTCGHDVAALVEWDTSDLSAAVDRYALSLLPGWYDDWLVLPRQRWDHARMHALELISEELLGRGAHAPAVDAASAAVAIEPMRETSRIALMRALIAEGNLAQALAERRSLNHLLRSELGIESSVLVDEYLTSAVDGHALRPLGSQGMEQRRGRPVAHAAVS